jgi:UDPglucose 6-dehydrogenase
MSYNVGVVGTGYVGIVSGTTFSETGNKVICVDIDSKKVEKMKRGEAPIYEPGLEHLMRNNIESGRLNFTTKLEDAVTSSTIIFLCLPTPPDEDGSADLKYVMGVASDIADIIQRENITDKKIIVNKSTVPVGTSVKVNEIFESKLGKNHKMHVCSNPEFLREGFAIEDATKPERVVIGTSSEWVGDLMRDLYKPFLRQGNPIHVMDEKSAEVTKYAANAFLATKISYMNDLAAYCETVGADIDSIRLGIGSDTRIGKRFLFAGIGYGGSCFPKDVQALKFSADNVGSPLRIVDATEDVNKIQIIRFYDKIVKRYGKDLSGKKFAIWGLAFKPNTDDVREAPAYKLIDMLLEAGAQARVYDQEAMEHTKERFGDKIEYARDMYSCLDNCTSLVIATEWTEFRTPDFDLIKDKLTDSIIFDGRNVYELSEMDGTGFEYYSIGRRQIK